jgi:hypothetical protein
MKPLLTNTASGFLPVNEFSDLKSFGLLSSPVGTHDYDNNARLEPMTLPRVILVWRCGLLTTDNFC